MARQHSYLVESLSFSGFELRCTRSDRVASVLAMCPFWGPGCEPVRALNLLLIVLFQPLRLTSRPVRSRARNHILLYSSIDHMSPLEYEHR